MNEEEALKALRIKRDAYLQVFGPIEHPTPLGEIILKDLKGFTRHGDEALHMDNNGRLDESTTLYRLGKQTVYQRIETMIKWSEHNGIGSRNSIPGINSSSPATDRSGTTE